MSPLITALLKMNSILRRIIYLPPDSPKSIAALANIVLLFLCFWLFRPVYPYLGIIFTREEFRTNQVVLLVVILLIAMQVRRGDFKPRILAHPQLNPLGLILVLFASGLFIVSERYLDINTLSASLFGLAIYGMVGLWMDVQRWQRGLPVALLLISALPFGEHMQTFIGYPVRIATAAVVREGLALFGVYSIGVDTILVFENGISQVDLPCSGVKSLWTGGIFLLAATWIERRPLNLRWLLIAFIFSVLLLAANLARVAILVAIGQVADLRLLAEMAHVPLGVIGFVGACAAAIWMLRRAGGGDRGPTDSPELQALVNLSTDSPFPVRAPWLAPALSGFLLILVILYTPRPRETSAQTLPEWGFPPSLQVTSWPLTLAETQILGEAGAESAQRWRFEWQGQTGSMLFVSSTTWRAHHRPERCFEVYGLSVNTTYAYMAAEDFPIRALSLGKGRNSSLYSAAYWLQSADSVTEDYAARIWSDLSPKRERWTLVTVLFDTAGDPVNQANLELYEHIRQSVADALGGGF
jgi:exosortase O